MKTHCPWTHSLDRMVKLILLGMLSSGIYSLVGLAQPQSIDGVPETQELKPEIKGINRVGILGFNHNMEIYRGASESRSSHLTGIPGAPLQGQALDFRMKELLLQAARLHGRFTLVDVGRPTETELSEITMGHELDSWLKVSVFFYPDHTRVEMALLDQDGQKLEILQSLDIEPDPSEELLTEAMAQVLARVGVATGHLSRVTWQSGDLVTIALGGRALRAGETLVAGRVRPDRVHPSSGEILSFQRTPLYHLDVLEVNDFSSLARVAMVLEEKVRENLLSQSTQSPGSANDALTGLLVWRPTEAKPIQASGDRPRNMQSGETASGFLFPEQKPAVAPAVPAAEDKNQAVAQETNPQISEGPGALSEVGRKPEEESNAQPAPTLEEESESFFPQSMTNFAEGFMPDLAWSAALSDPSSWVPRGYTVGAGQSYGIVDTTPCANKPCARYSGFPKVLINLVSFDAKYKLTRSAGLSFEGRFTNYPEGDVEGYEIGARALSLHRVAQTSQSVFDFYFGPELEIGSVNTVLLKRSLLAFSVRTGMGAEGPTPFGNYQADVDLSLLEFLRGKFALDMRLGWAEIPSLPDELGFFSKTRRSLKGWTQLELGVAWTFKPSQRRMPGAGTLGLPSW